MEGKGKGCRHVCNVWLGVGSKASRRGLQSGGRRRERKNKKRHEFFPGVNWGEDGWCGCQLHSERPRRPCALLSGRV